MVVRGAREAPRDPPTGRHWRAEARTPDLRSMIHAIRQVDLDRSATAGVLICGRPSRRARPRTAMPSRPDASTRPAPDPGSRPEPPRPCRASSGDATIDRFDCGASRCGNGQPVTRACQDRRTEHEPGGHRDGVRTRRPATECRAVTVRRLAPRWPVVDRPHPDQATVTPAQAVRPGVVAAAYGQVTGWPRWRPGQSASCGASATAKVAVSRQIFDVRIPVRPRTEYSRCCSSLWSGRRMHGQGGDGLQLRGCEFDVGG
jgi:hypothetical protein